MFCKFVVRIRHLSIKIIYTSRTGEMIVLYNPINLIIQIKNQITTMLFVYISPVSIAISYKIYFALLDNVQLSDIIVSSLSDGGILHFKNNCSLPKTVDVFHSHTTYKIHTTETLHISITPSNSSHPKIVSNPHTIQ